jgi:peptidoglycan/xylan/chitin deacetylase (PgdA/CDA1 family)
MRRFLLAVFCTASCSMLWALEPGDFVTHGPATAKRVALSFDDGPGPFTPQVLDILKKNGLHATFFMNGDQVKIRPLFAKRVHAEGHEIGDHTYSHRNFYTYKATDPKIKLKAQMELSKQVIQQTTGVTPVLCRMPYGYSRAWVRPIAKEYGYVLVNWTFGCDWTKMTPEAKRAAYIKAIHPGAIFLMHDGGIHREGTLYALEGLIEELKKRGYEMVTVGELIGLKPQ